VTGPSTWPPWGPARAPPACSRRWASGVPSAPRSAAARPTLLAAARWSCDTAALPCLRPLAIGRVKPRFNLIYGVPMLSYGIKFANVSNGPVVLSKVPGHGWAQSVTFLGGFELFDSLGNVQVRGRPGTPGSGLLGPGSVDIVPDPIGAEMMRSSPTAVAARFDPLRAKVAYGRLAMTAIIGMFFRDVLAGSVWGDSAPPWRHGAADAPPRCGFVEFYVARRRRDTLPPHAADEQSASAPSRPSHWHPSVPELSRRPSLR